MGMSFNLHYIMPWSVNHNGLKKLYICLILAYLPLLSFSQVPSLSIKYFSRADGLTDSYINQVTQDSTGFIWIGTRNGLFRYDGYEFTGYFSVSNDNKSIPGNDITSVYYDPNGKLWLGTNNGVCYYNPDSDNFTRISDFQQQNENLIISCITSDKQGTIYVSIYQTIFRFNEKAQHFKQAVTTEGMEVNTFLFDNENNLWVGCAENGGLFRSSFKKENDELHLKAGSVENVIKGVSINSLGYDGKRIWAATATSGIRMYDTGTGQTVQYSYSNSAEARASRIFVDKRKNVWAVDFAGLKVLTPGTRAFTGYYPRQNDPKSIRGSVKGVFQDRQGNYWVYHDPGGVGISMRLKGFAHFDNNPQDYWRTTDINIIALQEDRYGNLWCGNSTNGIDIFNWHTGRTTRYFYDSKGKYTLGQGATMCLFRDSHGTMWIGTYLGGLQYYDEGSRRFVSYLHNDKNPYSIAGNDVRSIAEDFDGNLWLAVHGKGVDKFDVRQKRFFHYTKNQNRLANNWTYQVMVDHRGDLWVGTLKGLSRLKKDESVFESFRSSFADSTTLPNDYITVVHEDKNNNLWVGTTSGLARYNPRKNNFIRYPDILVNSNISGILDDDQDRLWISTHDGISMFDPSSQKIKSFSSYDGLGADEYNPRAMYCNSSNEFFFGGIKGIDAFNPKNLRFNTKPPDVYIDGIRVFNKNLSSDSTGYKIRRNLRLVKKVTLSHKENIITIYFKALNYINPELNRYSYKLEGLDKKWHEPGLTREATYTNLRPGKYTFRVIASNNDGIWNTEGARLQIEVIPPWYATVVAITAFILLFIALVVLYIFKRTGALEKTRIILEKTVKDKTFELSVKNELLKKHAEHLDEVNRLLVERQNQLEQQSEELRKQSENLALANAELEKVNATKDKLFSIIGHDMSTPFSAIIGLTGIFETEYDSLTDDQKIEYIRDINLSAQKLYAMLQNLLLWARTQIMGISYNPSAVDLCRAINETMELRQGDLKNKRINSFVDCPEGTMVWADPDMTRTILRNLLGNAIKFTPKNGTVGISVRLSGSDVRISVSDTGKGISEEKIAQIMASDIVEPEWGTDGEKGSGIGLALSREFILRNKGQMEVSGRPGKGSIFTFTLPVNHSQ